MWHWPWWQSPHPLQQVSLSQLTYWWCDMTLWRINIQVWKVDLILSLSFSYCQWGLPWCWDEHHFCLWAECIWWQSAVLLHSDSQWRNPRMQWDLWCPNFTNIGWWEYSEHYGSIDHSYYWRGSQWLYVDVYIVEQICFSTPYFRTYNYDIVTYTSLNDLFFNQQMWRLACFLWIALSPRTKHSQSVIKSLLESC